MQRNNSTNGGRLYDLLTNEEPRLKSRSLEEIEAALREELQKQNTDLFNVLRLFDKIEHGLFREHPGFGAGSEKTVDDYFELMPERIGIPKQRVSHMRKVARAYYDNVLNFDTYDVDPKKRLSSLAHLQKALRNRKHRHSEVFAHLREDSVREFAKYAAKKEDIPDDVTVLGTKEKPTRKQTGAPKLVKASELDERHRSIASMLARRNGVVVLASPSEDHAERLRQQLVEYRSELLRHLSAEAGAMFPEDRPLAIPTNTSLFDVEESIRRYQRGDQVSKGKVAIGVFRVSTENALMEEWSALGFNNARMYCSKRLGIGSHYSWYLRIGQAIKTYETKLVAEGFAMNGQLYKLAYLQKVLDRASTDEEREEVFRRLRTDSFRAFKTLAQNEDTPITKEPEQFTSSVVKRAKAALKKISTVGDSLSHQSDRRLSLLGAHFSSSLSPQIS